MIKLILRFFKRAPDVIIDSTYLSRWFVIPRNRFFNIYLHKFENSDKRILHDHPWHSVSFLLSGELLEHSFNNSRHIPKWLPVFRSAKFAHRLQVCKSPVWTIFITGPRIRQWGFYTSDGWMHWKEFLESTIGYDV